MITQYQYRVAEHSFGKLRVLPGECRYLGAKAVAMTLSRMGGKTFVVIKLDAEGCMPMTAYKRGAEIALPLHVAKGHYLALIKGESC